MKCCCSHDVTGMFFACIYMMASAFGFVYFLFSFVETELRKHPEEINFFKVEDFEILLYFGGVSFISYLFTVAIEKRQRYLILPWLIFGLYAFYITVKIVWICRGYIRLIGVGYLTVLLLTLIFAIEITVICNSCCLFVKMRKEYLKEIERFKHQLNIEV